MVMSSAVRIILVHVEVGCLKGSTAGLADKTLLVIPTRELTIRGTDRLAIDVFMTASTFSFTHRRSFPSGRLWDWRRRW